jgi:hypothetical protein
MLIVVEKNIQLEERWAGRKSFDLVFLSPIFIKAGEAWPDRELKSRKAYRFISR